MSISIIMSSLSTISDTSSTPVRSNAPLAIQNVDEVDVSGFDKAVRAIIFPKSESAIHSLRLERNKTVKLLIEGSARLPSPCESSSEDETDSTISKATQYAAVLKQSKEKGLFTFGSSLESDIALEHLSHSASDEDLCYINYVHAKFYPNPDDDDFLLYNGSTSVFAFELLTSPWIKKSVLPKGKTILGRGTWKLTFGVGLDFQIKILPFCPTAMKQTWTQIFPIPVPIKVSSNRKVTRSALTQDVLPLPAPPAISKKAPRRKKSSTKIDHDTVEVKHQSKSSSSQIPSPFESASPVQHELVFGNKKTLVYKAASKANVFAIKYCREADVKASVETWQNELEILKRLDHVSCARMLVFHSTLRRFCCSLKKAQFSRCIQSNNNRFQSQRSLIIMPSICVLI